MSNNPTAPPPPTAPASAPAPATTTTRSKPNLLWRSMPWLTSRGLMHDTVASEDTTTLQEWRKSELDELATVNVTGALIAGVVSSSLSWPVLDDSPWTTKALFYSALVLALVSVVAGSQQSIMLHRVGSHGKGLPALKQLLTGAETNGIKKPSGLQLYVWQLPVMMLNISVFLFLIGLMILIWNYAAVQPAWDQDMKIAFVVTLAGLYALINYLIGTFSLYRLKSELENAHSHLSNTQGVAGPTNKPAAPANSGPSSP